MTVLLSPLTGCIRSLRGLLAAVPGELQLRRIYLRPGWVPQNHPYKQGCQCEEFDSSLHVVIVAVERVRRMKTRILYSDCSNNEYERSHSQASTSLVSTAIRSLHLRALSIVWAWAISDIWLSTGHRPLLHGEHGMDYCRLGYSG